MKTESIQKLKELIVEAYRKSTHTKIIIGNKSYTSNEIADEIENESELGIETIDNIIQLTIDLLSRGKI